MFSCPRCFGTERNRFGKCAACWEPSPGPQTRFLSLTCFEALYGGAAGGGKSDALLVDAVRYIGRGYGGSYKALILRREFPDLEKSLMTRSRELYPRLGGKPRNDGREWRFPGGEVVYFGHAQHEHDIEQYRGAEFQFVGFDELTSFTEYQYTYLISRIRSAHGVPLRLRSATNPGGVGHEWVLKRFAMWLDPKSEQRADPGQVVYLVKDGDSDVVVEKGSPGALGRTFVPARLEDNPFLASDGQYERGLQELDRVTRERLRNGNWLIKPARGMYFHRSKFQLVDATPADVVARVRRWDLAATEGAGDWTVGVKLARLRSGAFVVENVVRVRFGPRGVRQTVSATAALDGFGCHVVIPQDPGQAGKDQALEYASLLMGYVIRTPRETGDKVVRAGPASAQAMAGGPGDPGNIALVRAPWNEPFLQVLEAFPDETMPDDDVDALSGAVSYLALHSAGGFEAWSNVEW